MPFSLNRVVRKHAVTLNFWGLVKYIVGKHRYFPPRSVFLDYLATDKNKDGSILWRFESRKSPWVIPNHHCGLVWTVCHFWAKRLMDQARQSLSTVQHLFLFLFFRAYHKASFKLATLHQIHAATRSSYILISLFHILAQLIGLIWDCFTSWVELHRSHQVSAQTPNSEQDSAVSKVTI